MTAKHRTADVLELHAGHEYAVFTIDDQPERHYHALAIQSSYGGYSFAWSHPGCDFREFLCRLNVGYVLSKMVGSDSEFDAEATVKAVRRSIIERRRARDCSAGDARDEWDSARFEHRSEFDIWWTRDTVMFRDDEPWEFARTTGGSRSREFTALYEKFWPLLTAELRGASVQQEVA